MKHKQMKAEKSKAHMLEGLAKDWDRLEDTRRQQKQHRMSIVAWDIWDLTLHPPKYLRLQPLNIVFCSTGLYLAVWIIKASVSIYIFANFVTTLKCYIPQNLSQSSKYMFSHLPDAAVKDDDERRVDEGMDKSHVECYLLPYEST